VASRDHATQTGLASSPRASSFNETFTRHGQLSIRLVYNDEPQTLTSITILNMHKASRAIDSPPRARHYVGAYRPAYALPPSVEITCDRCSRRFTNGV